MRNKFYLVQGLGDKFDYERAQVLDVRSLKEDNYTLAVYSKSGDLKHFAQAGLDSTNIIRLMSDLEESNDGFIFAIKANATSGKLEEALN